MEEEYFKIIVEKKLNETTTTEEDKFLKKFEQTMLDKNKANVFSDYSNRKNINKDIFLKINVHIKNKRKIKKRAKLLNIAASAIILFSFGFYYLYFNNETEIVYQNNTNSPQKYTLIDGSIITLNQNSKLVQDKNFNNKNRFVELQGEAYFEIKKNKSIPFIIKTNIIFTKVIGTKFNIYSNEDNIKVSVNEGHVKVYDSKDTLDATPNQQITYNLKNNKLAENSIKAELFNLWTKDEYALNNITIAELSRIFESVYKHQIIFKNEKIKNMKISITFHRNDKIETVLDKINLINEFKLTKKQNNMIEAY